MIRILALRNGAPAIRRPRCLSFFSSAFLDDDLYQARENPVPARGPSGAGHRPHNGAAARRSGRGIEDGVRAHLTRAAAGLRDLFVAPGLVRDVHVRNIHLPWRRLFEVGFDVEVELS